MGMIKRILLHFDASSSAKRAMDYALYLAGKLNASVTTLYVIQVKAPKQLTPDSVDKEPAREAEECLQDAKERAKVEGLEIETKVLVARSIGDAVAEEAIEGGYDIILMGSDNSTGFRRFISKSTPEEVLKRTNCPVLIIS